MINAVINEIQKLHLQPVESAIKAPKSGPRHGPTKGPIDHPDKARPRSSTVNKSAKIPSPKAIHKLAPILLKNLNTMRESSVGANSHPIC